MSEYEYKILKRKEIDLDRTIQKYSKLGFRLISVSRLGDYCGDLNKDGSEEPDYTLFHLVFEKKKRKTSKK